MAYMELIQEKVNEGMFLAAFGLESRVLANGVLPQNTLPERASLVKGILAGLLEKGLWQTAVELVYANGAVRALFDGNYEGFRQDALASAKRAKAYCIREKTITTLLAHNEAGLLRDIVAHALSDSGQGGEQKQFSEDTQGQLSHATHRISDEISPEERKSLYTYWGRYYWSKENFEEALYNFKSAENAEEINRLYGAILQKNLSEKRRGWDALLSIADSDRSKTRERLTEIIHKFIGENAKDDSLGKKLYELSEEFYLSIPERMKNALKKCCARSIHTIQPIYDYYGHPESTQLNKLKRESSFRLLWAKEHAEDKPAAAYHIFKEQNYNGPRMVDAVKHGIERSTWSGHDDEKLPYPEIERKHLEMAYKKGKLKRETKASIAHYLDDKEKLKRLSNEYYKSGDEVMAYRLWFDADADPNAQHIKDIRQKLIDAEMEKKNESPSVHFLFAHNDLGGMLQMYTLVFDRYPETAYELAGMMNDEPLLTKARQRLVEDSPERALRLMKGYSDGCKDPVGYNLALQAIAQKYDLPAEKIKGYFAGNG